jgi:hypothetical protein
MKLSTLFLIDLHPDKSGLDPKLVGPEASEPIFNSSRPFGMN